VLSPAKALDETVTAMEMTRPAAVLDDDRAELLRTCVKLSKADLQKLMSLSGPLADLNHKRYAAFESQDEKPCGWAFDGPAHKALSIATLDQAQQDYAQDHIITLSGLYGFLKPRDAIRPHRLEMGTKLKTERGGSLYDFWGDRITKELATLLAKLPEEERFVVNTASQEYWAVVAKHVKLLGAAVYTIEFPGPSVYAKQARGSFCRFMCREGVKSAEQLKDFAQWTEKEGLAVYKYIPGKDPFKLCFQRTTAAAPKSTAKKTAPKKDAAAKKTAPKKAAKASATKRAADEEHENPPKRATRSRKS